MSPPDGPVLVTGAGGFVGGHVARDLACSGYRVRGLARRPPRLEPGDPAIDWIFGDLRDPADRARALQGVVAVVHAAGWVSLGADPKGEGLAVNVGATRDLIADCARSKIGRIVSTSTLHTLAAGSVDSPADEDTPWNLDRVRSPYESTKRAAERMIRDAGGVALCPGMVLGPRDPKPTSTRVLLAMARSPLAVVPGGGIPVVDARVVALAHRRALEVGEPGARYAVVGPYLSYRELAILVGTIAGRPRRVFALPDACEGPLARLAGRFDRLSRGRRIDLSAAAVAGAFLKLHVRGDRADTRFGLVHPDPAHSIFDALADAIRVGLAPGLILRPPAGAAAGGGAVDRDQ